MTITWYFYNSSPSSIWIRLTGPELRDSGCFEIKPGCQDCGIDYEATSGLKEPNGTWWCNVFSDGFACDLNVTRGIVVSSAVEISEKSARVTWHYTDDEIPRITASVAYT